MQSPGIYLQLLIAFLFLSCNSAIKKVNEDPIVATVIAIKDGDTIELLYEGKPLKIRFAHVDCPEIRKGQPFGKDAKQLTSTLCFGQTVKVFNEGQYDRYGRLIAVIINEQNKNVNKELVKAGLAWHYKQYSSDTSYANLENTARQNKMGLWADKNPTPPWSWRKKNVNILSKNPGEAIVQ